MNVTKWDRKLWGVVFQSDADKRRHHLIGEAWHDDREKGILHDADPLRVLLFETRTAARKWANAKNESYRARPELKHWRMQVVRVRELVEVIK